MCLNCLTGGSWNPTSPAGRRTTAELDQGAADAIAHGVTGNDLGVAWSTVEAIIASFQQVPGMTYADVIASLDQLRLSYRELQAAVLRVEGRQALERGDAIAATVATYVAGQESM